MCLFVLLIDNTWLGTAVFHLLKSLAYWQHRQQRQKEERRQQQLQQHHQQLLLCVVCYFICSTCSSGVDATGNFTTGDGSRTCFMVWLFALSLGDRVSFRRSVIRVAQAFDTRFLLAPCLPTTSTS